jgi:hypothetical protein
MTVCLYACVDVCVGVFALYYANSAYYIIFHAPHSVLHMLFGWLSPAEGCCRSRY